MAGLLDGFEEDPLFAGFEEEGTASSQRDPRRAAAQLARNKFEVNNPEVRDFTGNPEIDDDTNRRANLEEGGWRGGVENVGRSLAGAGQFLTEDYPQKVGQELDLTLESLRPDARGSPSGYLSRMGDNLSSGVGAIKSMALAPVQAASNLYSGVNDPESVADRPLETGLDALGVMGPAMSASRLPGALRSAPPTSWSAVGDLPGITRFKALPPEPIVPPKPSILSRVKPAIAEHGPAAGETVGTLAGGSLGGGFGALAGGQVGKTVGKSLQSWAQKPPKPVVSPIDEVAAPAPLQRSSQRTPRQPLELKTNEGAFQRTPLAEDIGGEPFELTGNEQSPASFMPQYEQTPAAMLREPPMFDRGAKSPFIKAWQPSDSALEGDLAGSIADDFAPKSRVKGSSQLESVPAGPRSLAGEKRVRNMEEMPEWDLKTEPYPEMQSLVESQMSPELAELAAGRAGGSSPVGDSGFKGDTPTASYNRPAAPAPKPIGPPPKKTTPSSLFDEMPEPPATPRGGKPLDLPAPQTKTGTKVALAEKTQAPPDRKQARPPKPAEPPLEEGEMAQLKQRMEQPSMMEKIGTAEELILIKNVTDPAVLQKYLAPYGVKTLQEAKDILRYVNATSPPPIRK